MVNYGTTKNINTLEDVVFRGIQKKLQEENKSLYNEMVSWD